MLTIEDSYQLFLETERQLLNEHGENMVINDLTRSFFFDWFPSNKKKRSTYMFHENFFHLFCEQPGFCYAYELFTVDDEGEHPSRGPSLFFRSNNGHLYSFFLTFQRRNHSITIHFSDYHQDRHGVWYSHSVNKKDITPYLARWREIYQQAVLSLPKFRLLDVTGSLKIEHK